MCVIIEKLATKEIPFDDILAGAYRNQDGYGVAVADRGKIEIIRGLGSPKVAAETVQKTLEQAKGLEAFVHLRYRTKGDINIDNCQPFQILKRSEGTELVFMHNGTFTGFGMGKDSDSLEFARQVVEPLARRSAAFSGADEIVNDPFVAEILKHYASSVSKLVLFDGYGDSLIINRKAGVEKDYGWASNSYSLAHDNIPEEKKTSVPGHSFNQHSKIKTAITCSIGYRNYEDCAPNIRMNVEELTGFPVEQFCKLSPDQVRELVNDEPDVAAVLILDMQHMLFAPKKFNLIGAHNVTV